MCDENISPSKLFQEVQDMKFLVKSRIPETARELLLFSKKDGEGFANLRVALRILLTVGVSVTFWERSFIKLKLITTYLRNSMGQDRLTILTLLTIESDTLMEIDCDAVIIDFAHYKTRKMLMYNLICTIL